MASYIDSDGYIRKSHLGHPRANDRGYVLEHILIAERALGRYLPKGAVIHHFDENLANNSNNNLVICENHKYHKLLHYRQRIIKAGGDPEIQKICSSCYKLKLKTEFSYQTTTVDGLQTTCKDCKIVIQRNIRRWRAKQPKF